MNSISCYDKCLGCSNAFPKYKFNGGETAPKQFSFRHCLHNFLFVGSYFHIQYLSDALDLCHLLNSALMVRGSPVNHGSGEFDWSKNQLKPMERLPVDFGCLPSHSQAGLHSAHSELPGWHQDHGQICSVQHQVHGPPLQQIKDPTVKSCFVHSDSNLNFIKRSLAVQGLGWRSVHRQEADGMPEFVPQRQQSTMGSSKEDTQNSSKQGNL